MPARDEPDSSHILPNGKRSRTMSSKKAAAETPESAKKRRTESVPSKTLPTKKAAAPPKGLRRSVTVEDVDDVDNPPHRSKTANPSKAKASSDSEDDDPVLEDDEAQLGEMLRSTSEG